MMIRRFVAIAFSGTIVILKGELWLDTHCASQRSCGGVKLLVVTDIARAQRTGAGVSVGMKAHFSRSIKGRPGGKKMISDIHV
jgi:hypothetical protein